MRKVLTSVAEASGAACLTIAAFMLTPIVGVATLGVFLIAAGVVLA